jgi:hypothetical protein
MDDQRTFDEEDEKPQLWVPPADPEPNAEQTALAGVIKYCPSCRGKGQFIVTKKEGFFTRLGSRPCNLCDGAGLANSIACVRRHGLITHEHEFVYPTTFSALCVKCGLQSPIFLSDQELAEIKLIQSPPIEPVTIPSPASE